VANPDESRFGKRDAFGAYQPKDPITYAPINDWPPNPGRVWRWFVGWPGFLLPWYLVYSCIAVATWFWLTPPVAVMADFAPGWILTILGRNYLLVVVWYGLWSSRLYLQKAQGTFTKYNPQFPEGKNDSFLWNNQLLDNLTFVLGSGVPIMTGYEVLGQWLYANGMAPMVDIASVWGLVWVGVLLLSVPFWTEVHFFIVHRLIHWQPLYRAVHHLHHRNVNPTPWSGISMHPIEHLLYFSVILGACLIPAHPIVLLAILMRSGLGPGQGHAGFEQVVVPGGGMAAVGDFPHYLHHKYFEVNYANELLPLDRLFGSFHDGSEAADAQLHARMKRKAGRGRSERSN
jgi:sterol desaturase/sphingolipid hydroxylase (fatty acid hydroxylase superfamily)